MSKPNEGKCEKYGCLNARKLKYNVMHKGWANGTSQLHTWVPLGGHVFYQACTIMLSVQLKVKGQRVNCRLLKEIS